MGMRYAMLSIWILLTIFAGAAAGRIILLQRQVDPDFTILKWKTIPLSVKVISVLALAALTRVLYWAVDPMAFEGIIHHAVTYVFGGLYAPVSLIALSLLAYNWSLNVVMVLLGSTTSVQELGKFRRVLRVICYASVFSLPLSIVGDILFGLNSSIEMYQAALALNLAGIVWYLLVLVGISISGVLMYKRMRKIMSATTKHMTKSIMNMIYLASGVLLFALGIIAVIIVGYVVENISASVDSFIAYKASLDAVKKITNERKYSQVSEVSE